MTNDEQYNQIKKLLQDDGNRIDSIIIPQHIDRLELYCPPIQIGYKIIELQKLLPGAEVYKINEDHIGIKINTL